MAKYIGPVCKLCRREGEKLFLKGERCFSPKCSFDKRDYAPGQHGRNMSRRRRRESDYGKQLRAKQRARRVYGVFERQFSRYYKVALQRRGLTGLNLLQILESRLDNVVYRMGFASSRAEARLMVTHGHYIVNGRRTDIPSMLLKDGDEISVREGSRKLSFFKTLGELVEKRNAPAWLDRDAKSLAGKVGRLPERTEIDGSLNEQLIVEYYSR
ncbi:MAG: 30S ribosomal protein S4 [Anaerolineae bacterium]|jgi:small subunit ribosomal protein S4|nr:30S ribosomal protein S4 [Anaerolineae bacterium]MBT3713496.1 30S ribosomal protein S4 [Anaerolineae bacterium]MBT4312108.1 30S ribosomal protein S4 [Anaerolineae bacterium]MBT4457159.1 30S ribosomal protein S4 [Anaerolineae bacterium]MBT4843084.1 30S ribosomal protein S4 [Anaerolineae bacterium]